MMSIADQPAEVRQLYLGLMGLGATRAAAGLALDVLLEEARASSVPLRGLLVLMLPEQILDDLLAQLADGTPPFRSDILIPLLRLPDKLRFEQGRNRRA